MNSSDRRLLHALRTIGLMLLTVVSISMVGVSYVHRETFGPWGFLVLTVMLTHRTFASMVRFEELDS